MKITRNPLIIAVVLIIITATAYWAFSLSQKQQAITDSAVEEQNGGNAAGGIMPAEEDTSGSPSKQNTGDTSARYSEYTSGILDVPTSNRRVLFFYANWCPTCKPADTDFKNNEKNLPDDVTVIRVNYNDNQTDKEEKDLAAKYGVTYQHTYVQIDEDGREVTKWNGGQASELVGRIF